MKNDYDASILIKIQMLGGFSISAGSASVQESDSHSRKAWLLLQYLTAFRRREISPSELISILWPDTELSNPSGSLKSLVFRARKLLAPLPVSSLLIQQNGIYRWNPAFQTEADFEELDQIYHQLFTSVCREEERISLCQRGISLYRGEFLPNSAGESWVIPINTYYSSLYLKIAHYYMDLLTKDEKYDEIITLCRRVLTFEPYDETTHYYLTYSLYLGGNQQAAISHYQAVIDSFYSHPGELPALTSRFTSLYKIISSEAHAHPADLDSILSQLSENTLPRYSSGAYFCEYVVFRDLCQVTMRNSSRTGNCAYLCLFSITVLDQKSIRPQTLTKAVDSLYQAIATSLRSGDVFSRYSSEQYILLLLVDADNSKERAKQAIRRIMKRYRTLYPRTDLALEYSLKPLS